MRYIKWSVAETQITFKNFHEKLANNKDISWRHVKQVMVLALFCVSKLNQTILLPCHIVC